MRTLTSRESTPRMAMVVPCFNESKRLRKDYWDFLVDRAEFVKWIFVDDGSSDNTFEILSTINKDARIIQLKTNGGKSEAIRHGVTSALREYPSLKCVGYVDADMAFEKEGILDFCLTASDKLFENNFDAVIGSRVKLAGRRIVRSSRRHFFARVIATVFGLFWDKIPYDTQCGLKLFKLSEEFRSSVLNPFNTRWLFDIELFMRIQEQKHADIALYEFPLSYWCEVGKSKVSGLEYFRIAKEVMSIIKLMLREN